MSVRKDSDAANLKADKEGFLEHHKDSTDKKKTKTQKFYFRLAGGTLYFYENEKVTKAKGVLQLKGVTVEEQVVDKKNLVVLSGEGQVFKISGADVSDWATAIRGNLNKEPYNLELKGEAAKMGFIMKAKKNIAGKAATSSFGKSVINKVIDDEIKALLNAVKNIIAVIYGSKEQAERLEKNAIKIVVKAYFLWENKTIPLEAFQKVEDPLKKALKLLIAVFDHIEKVKDDKLKAEILDEKFTVAAVLLDNVKEQLTSLLGPHLKPKSIARINESFDKVANRDFLLKTHTEESLKPDVNHVMGFIRNYVKR